MPDPTITPAQYRAALEALGLDPAMTVSVTVQADYAHILLVATDEHGTPTVDLGRLATRAVGVTIRDPEPEPAPDASEPVDETPAPEVAE